MNGKLIVFEGVEGAGKTTQLNHLHQWLQQDPDFQGLQQQGLIPEVIVTREPGGTPLGKALRSLLLGQEEYGAIADHTELLLYAADRAQHLAEVIRPALAAGSWVICDRYVDSTVAYQGYGRGLSLSLIETLNHIATQGIASDLTLWLKLSADVGLTRSRQRGSLDRIEQANQDFHRRVQHGFEILAETHQNRIVPIEAEGSVDTIAQHIQTLVKSRLKTWYGHHLKT